MAHSKRASPSVRDHQRTRPKAECLRRVGVALWHKNGLLATKRTFERSWTGDGKKIGAIKVDVDPGLSVTLSYEYESGETKEPVSMLVRLLTTPCHFGGSRPWFECPSCKGRAGMLYLVSKYFACRRCTNVAHTSQSETPAARAFRKEKRIETKLAAHGSKPKWMRIATYRRLWEELADTQMKQEELFETAAKNFLKRHKCPAAKLSKL